jgi:hypothetical protein
MGRPPRSSRVPRVRNGAALAAPHLLLIRQRGGSRRPASSAHPPRGRPPTIQSERFPTDSPVRMGLE